MSHTGTAHPFHMWTKFGDDMSKRLWVMLDKTDRLTDRQTDRQTNRQTNILAKNCKFWQVMMHTINYLLYSAQLWWRSMLLIYFRKSRDWLSDINSNLVCVSEVERKTYNRNLPGAYDITKQSTTKQCVYHIGCAVFLTQENSPTHCK